MSICRKYFCREEPSDVLEVSEYERAKQLELRIMVNYEGTSVFLDHDQVRNLKQLLEQFLGETVETPQKWRDCGGC